VILTLTAQPIGTCPASSDAVTITYFTAPIANAGSDASTCEETAFTLSGTSAPLSNSVLWTTNGTGLLSDATTLTPTYTPAAGEYGMVTLTLTATGTTLCPAAVDQMVLSIDKQAVVSAGEDAAICENSTYQLTMATANNTSSLLWTSSGNGSFSNETILNPTYQPSQDDIDLGSVILTLTAQSAGTCLETSDAMVLHILPEAIPDAGLNATICEGNDYHLTGTSALNSSAVQWTTSGTGTFSNANILEPVYTPSIADIKAGSVVLTLNAAGNPPCQTVSDAMELTFIPAPVAQAGQDATICETSTSYLCRAFASNYVNFYWSTTGTGKFSEINILDPIYIPSEADIAAGCVYLVIHVNGNPPCDAVTDTMKLCISRIPEANAGPDDMICQGFTYQLSGSSALYYGDLTWVTSGSGTFNDTKIVHPVYTPSLADYATGSVTLAMNLTANSPCPNSSDTMVLQIHPNPVATASLVANVKCNGFSDGSVTVSVTGGTPEYTYKWSDGQTTATATGLNAGTYTVTVTDNYGCIDISSATVDINPLPVLVITNPADVCAPNTVDLTDPLVTAGSTLYNAALSYWNDVNHSISMTTPTVAGAGIYYIQATTAPGCFDIEPVTVTVNPLPDANAGADKEICINESTVLGATLVPGNTYAWSSVPAGFVSSLSNPTVSPSITTVYTLTETITATGCSNTHSVTVTVDPASAGGLVSSDQTICSGTTPADLQLNGNVGTVVKWQKSTDQAFTSPVDISATSLTLSGTTIGNLTENTWFRAEVQSGVCSPAYSSQILVTVNPNGQVNLPEPLVVCSGEAAEVTFSTNNSGGITTYSWTNNTTSIGLEANGSGDISFIATNTGTSPVVATVVVTPFYSNGGVICEGSPKSFTITVNPLGMVENVENQILCSGSTTTAITFSTANTGGNTLYSWTNDLPGIGLASSGTGNIAAFTALNSGSAPAVATITVTPVFENSNLSCTGVSKSFSITVNPAGQVVDPTDQIVCNGAMTAPVNFTTNNTIGVTTYTWTNNLTSIGLAANGSGNIPAFSAINTGIAPVVATIIVTPLFTYGSLSCTGPAQTFSITVNPSGQVIDPADQVVCNGSSTSTVTFATNNTGGSTTYTWLNNTPAIGLAASGSGNIPAFTATNSGSAPLVAAITVTPHYTNGSVTCAGIAQVFTITVNPAAQVNDPADQIVCHGGLTNAISFTTVNSTGITTYTWTNNTPGIGLAANGSGNIAAFNAINTGTSPITATVVVTPYFTYGAITCTGGSQSFTITVNPIPVVVTHPQSTCSPNKVDLTAAGVTSGSTPGLTFTYWTDAAGTIAYPTPAAAMSGTYYIKGTFPATGCYSIKPVTVTVHPLPTVYNGTGGGSYCAGGPGLLVGISGSQIGVNYSLWYGCCYPTGITVAGTGGPIDFGLQTIAGYYSVRAENTITGCINWMYNCVVITINPLPTAFNVTGGGSYCEGGSGVLVGLSGSQPGVNYTLVPGGSVVAGTGNAISFGLRPAGVYSVTAKSAATNCTNNMVGSVTVIVNPLPGAIAGANRSVCLNASTQIGATAVPGSSYSWISSPAGFTSTLANPVVSPLISTTYTLTEIITATGCVNTHSVLVSVNPLPEAIAGASRSICLNSVTQIGAAPVVGNTYAWTSSPAGFTSSLANPQVSPLVSTTYTLTETIAATGCSNTHSVLVSVNPLPGALAGADRTICLNATTQLGASPVAGSVYSWASIPAGFTSSMANPSVTPQESTTYTLTETISATGCTNSHSVVVTVNPLPGAIAGNDRAICLNTTTQLGAAAVSGNTYSWTSAPAGFISTEANPSVTPLVSTRYTVTETITATGCSKMNSVLVTVTPLPAAAAGSDRAICLNSATVLGAPSNIGSTYSWTSSPGGFTSTLANPTVSPLVTSTYTLTETIVATGCNNTHSVVVTVNPLPGAVAGTNRAICLNAHTQIGAPSVPGNTYMWSSVPAGFTSTLSNPMVSPLINTSYTVIETITATGCSNSNSVFVTVNPLPNAIAGTDRSVCLNSATRIGAMAVSGSIYQWTSLPSGFTSTVANPFVSPLITTTYTVTETIIATGCTNSHSVVVSVNPNPHLIITNPTPVCSPNKIDLRAAYITAGSTLFGATLSYWLDPLATVPMTNFAAAGAGTYYIKATTPEGCYDIKPVTVTVNPLPTLYTGIGSGSYCAGGPGLIVGLSGSQVGVTYTLYYGCCASLGIAVAGTGGPISFNPPVTAAGAYSVRAENTITGCVNWMNNCINVTIDPVLPVSVSITASANPVPAGTAVTFTAIPVNGGSSPSFQWEVNGVYEGTNNSTFTYIPATGDIIACVLTSNAPCAAGNPSMSNTVVMGIPASNVVSGIVANGQSKCYNALQTLTVAGGGTTFTIQNGGVATMIAGQNIRYLPGTTVQAGGYMHGYITVNNQYCLQSPAMVTALTGGVEEVTFTSDVNSFIIYPNPTSGNFTLEQKSTRVYEKVVAEVYSMRGERLMTREMVGEKKHEFWTSDLPHGLYFVKIVADEYVETFKLVKIR
jgi:hypothetical protein